VQQKGKTGAPKNGKLLNKYAENEWNRIIPLLQQVGILHEVGKSVLLVYCNEVGLYFQCMDEMKKGLIIKKGGWQGPKPEVALAKSAASNILKYSVQFGLTPASADGISRDPKGDEIDDLMKP